ncbi:glycosyltransferase [bacterium]|nr:glycosyltransferase [bacterium]
MGLPKFAHIHFTYLPYLCGITNRMRNIIHHVGDKKDHFVVCYDRDHLERPQDTIEGVDVYRFDDFDEQTLHRYLHLGAGIESELNESIQCIRAKRADVLCLYYHRGLPQLIRHALPEKRLIYMPVFIDEHFSAELFNHPRVKIILFGKSMLQACLDHGIDRSSIHVLEKPIDTAFFSPLPLERHPRRLLYVGRINQCKQIPEFLESIAPLFDKYPNLHFHIVGDCAPTLFPQQTKDEIDRIKQKAHALRIQDRIVFLGKKSGRDLLEEYSRSSIHVLPGRGECRSTVTQESLAMGLTCVNYKKHPYDWPDTRPDGVQMIHYVDDVAEFKPILDTLLANSPLPSHRPYVESHWSWNQWRREYEKAFSAW